MKSPFGSENLLSKHEKKGCLQVKSMLDSRVPIFFVLRNFRHYLYFWYFSSGSNQKFTIFITSIKYQIKLSNQAENGTEINEAVLLPNIHWWLIFFLNKSMHRNYYLYTCHVKYFFYFFGLIFPDLHKITRISHKFFKIFWYIQC